MRAGKTAPLALAVSLLLVGCTEDDDDDGGAQTSGPLLAGFSMATPSLEGSWVISSTPSASGCGALNILFTTESVLTITQAGNAFEFALVDPCGRPIPGGEGRVGPDRIVELVSRVDRSLTAECTLELKRAQIGSVESPPDAFSGTDALTISGSDQPGFDHCDPSLPCDVTGTFIARRCPRSGCEVSCVP